MNGYRRAVMARVFGILCFLLFAVMAFLSAVAQPTHCWFVQEGTHRQRLTLVFIQQSKPEISQGSGQEPVPAEDEAGIPAHEQGGGSAPAGEPAPAVPQEESPESLNAESAGFRETNPEASSAATESSTVPELSENAGKEQK